ncbi:MAG: HU family DNA-binding protein, partial [Leptospiraceae bacterium]|nr:HU family DNA-binding protein [Leptospiraceae bacterium]
MNRSQFVESLKSVVASKKFSDFDESKTDSVVRTFFASICEALLEGRKVELRGFGTFELRNYKGYNGIN